MSRTTRKSLTYHQWYAYHRLRTSTCLDNLQKVGKDFIFRTTSQKKEKETNHVRKQTNNGGDKKTKGNVRDCKKRILTKTKLSMVIKIGDVSLFFLLFNKVKCYPDTHLNLFVRIAKLS